MPRRKIIGLVVDPATTPGQAVIDGVGRFNREHGEWDFSMTAGMPYVPLELLDRWQGDGAIGVRGDVLAPIMRRRKIPFVNIDTRPAEPKVATVVSDGQAVGRLVARHLMDKALRRFAVITWKRDVRWEAECRTFEQTVCEESFTCKHLTVALKRRHGITISHGTKEIATYLQTVDEPVGIFTVHDMISRGVVDACSDANLHVPEDVAVVGVGNLRATCEMRHPTLTSVELGAERVGYRAAQVLADLLAGKPGPAETILIPPTAIVPRESSDMLAIQDAYLRQALQFIKDNHRRLIQVPDVVDAVGTNRRSLENRFRQFLGRTVHDEIRRSRIATACQLLVETDLTVKAIYPRCGYRSWQVFIECFHRETSMNPTQYRRTHSRW